MALNRLNFSVLIGGWAVSLMISSSVNAATPMSICSKLDFNGVAWSPTLPEKHHVPFSLALNITGSFEGDDGWSNLSNNFDGMGFSMGLLNQNLGVGSLQPLFIAMRNRDLTTMKKVFAPANLSTLLDMLATWEKSAPASSETSRDFLRSYGFSDLDDPAVVAQELDLTVEQLEERIQTLAIDRNGASVDWAKKNVLKNDKDIKDDWVVQLKETSVTAIYRSLQAAAAESLHNQAMALFSTYKMTELRSYLFFFDIIVQNGGLPDAVLFKYNRFIKSYPKTTETARLKKILQLRLPYVRARFRHDVQSRKLSIINGTGKVHGSFRNYEKEFCTDINIKMP